MPTATETPTETVAFNSKCPNLVLTLRPERHVDDGMGGKVKQTFEMWLDSQRQKNHEREVAGLPPLEIDETPWKVEFHHHTFRTDSPRLIERLRAHVGYNAATPNGFFEVGRAPDEPRPTLTEQMTAIAEAQGNLDADALANLLDSERENHNRPAVIQAAEVALRVMAEGPSGLEGDAGQTGDGDPQSTSRLSLRG